MRLRGITSGCKRGTRRKCGVCSRLGVPMSTAIDMYLNQIFLTGGVSFAVALPKTPDTINVDLRTTAELHAKLQKGYNDIEAGKV